MSTRCELTDLLVDGCAHCRGNTVSPDEEAAEYTAVVNTGRWFHAVYPGVCICCGTPFTAGTPIRMEIPRGWRADCCREEAP